MEIFSTHVSKTVYYAWLLFSCLVVSEYLQHHGQQYARLPFPSPYQKDGSISCPFRWRWYPSIFSSVVYFFSCLQSFPASGSFPLKSVFWSGGQSIGVSISTSVLPMNSQDWFPSGLTGLISLQSKGYSRVFSNTIVQKHQFFSASFLYGPTLISIHDYWKNHSFD